MQKEFKFNKKAQKQQNVSLQKNQSFKNCTKKKKSIKTNNEITERSIRKFTEKPYNKKIHLMTKTLIK